MTTDFPTAPGAYGLNGPSAPVTVEKSTPASHTEILTPPLGREFLLNKFRRSVLAKFPEELRDTPRVRIVVWNGLGERIDNLRKFYLLCQ